MPSLRLQLSVKSIDIYVTASFQNASSSSTDTLHFFNKVFALQDYLIDHDHGAIALLCATDNASSPSKHAGLSIAMKILSDAAALNKKTFFAASMVKRSKYYGQVSWLPLNKTLHMVIM